ncbi:riboflavin kinase / FMN adenylyltransferase [Oceanospirillum multiglobuliferum]|uniref:Riboflavin biosynthesis protein n=1 Tax=Oceanospirillum multiglobuliferum TaxID=64969 RepID=A0A1T4LXC1_9GAMM|nr:bifunctional riboflavin kinase/FAD synthetase [Oceanospirillum multiglobuliferum]OPX56322.1 riboflavin biosynthesis protein RibF [Oceanospirillum multiglobuliferum]SJZ59390.1 riboflavin kinase / FMN adenylyltransferase [Oceanospirillum multiglobuliferum]
MELIRGLHNLRKKHQGCVVTIGNFDGVHLGHQAVLQQVKAKAEELNLPSVVVIFEPQPREFFAGSQAPARITRFRDKVERLKAQGVDRVLCLSFNRRLASLSAQAFIEQVLLAGLGVRYLVVGDDFRFGCDRSGNFALLKQAGAAQGFEVANTHTFEVAAERVSSTRIRQVLADANFVLAQNLLGLPYQISGRVIHGQKLGRQLGVPTANLSLQNKQPALQGVYAVLMATQDQVLRQGVANIGNRPTVSGVRPALEVNLFDFNGDLYGQRVQVIFCSKLRDEVRFANVEALREQIQRDQLAARAYFANHADQGIPLAQNKLNLTDNL